MVRAQGRLLIVKGSRPREAQGFRDFGRGLQGFTRTSVTSPGGSSSSGRLLKTTTAFRY